MNEMKNTKNMKQTLTISHLSHFLPLTALFLLGVMLFSVPFASAFCFWWWCPDLTPQLAVVQPSNANILQYSFHFWQVQQHYLNQTSNPNQVLDRIVASYNKRQLDYITGNQPLQFYIYYQVLIKTWNINNPSYSVKECNLSARIWHNGATNPYYKIDKNFGDVDYSNAKEFFSLDNGDTIFIDMNCKFNGTQIPSGYDTPASMQLVTPTWNCKACQFYDWAISYKSVLKSANISDKTTQIITYINKVIFLNFEMWTIFFWVIIILLFFTAIGLIFMFVYWLFIYMRSKIK